MKSMTTSAAACVEFGSHSQIVKQEQSTSFQTEPAAQHQHMATGSADSPWTSYHSLPQYDDDYANTLSNDQQSITWPSIPHAAAMTVQDHSYQLETITDRMDSGSCATTSGWPGASCAPMHPPHPLLLSPAADPGRPRTFSTMDVSPMLTGYCNTIDPHHLYQSGPPRSEPYHYGVDPEINAHQKVCKSVEESTPLQQGVYGYYEHHDDSPSYHSTPCEEDISMDEEDGFGGEKHEPYAKSLYRCLRDAPGHTMVLRDIYEWFKTNTARGREPHEKGWQNSIRHNLSMNKAFEKIEVTSPDEPSKKGYKWRLSDQALQEGRVQSTTRFRNKQPTKRGSKSHNPAPHRQASGARGGRMARFAAEARRSERLREARNNLRQSYHNLRSSGIIPSDTTVLGHISVPVSPIHPGTSSPYRSLEQIYDWNQHPQYIPALGSHPSHVSQHEPYMVSSNTPVNTPARTPEIHWGPPTDRIFYDSSDPTTPITPRTPSSYGDATMDPTVFALGNLEECQI